MGVFMRLILFVLSITFSAGLFVMKTNMMADMQATWANAPAASSPADQGQGFADAMMAQAMAIMGAGAAANMAVPAAAPAMGGMPDTKALQSQIESQLKGFEMGGNPSNFNRPKDFNARFVKARETN